MRWEDLTAMRKPAAGLLLALNASGRPIYAGTVSPAEKARRRTKNKLARRSRRINRARS